MGLPERKPNRLKEYDYSSNGAYFITICVTNRENLLGEVVGGDAYIAPHMRLSEYGCIVDKFIQTIIGIDKYVIMPNHIHMIIIVDGSMWASTPTQSIPQLIRSFKTLITKEIGHSIFQRSYHDHIIRNKKDYLKIWNYIDTNPDKWKEDCFYEE